MKSKERQHLKRSNEIEKEKIEIEKGGNKEVQEKDVGRRENWQQKKNEEKITVCECNKKDKR